MSKWIACGAVTNPKTSREFLRFESKRDYITQEEAEIEAQQWRKDNLYPFVWVEKVER